MIHPAQPAPSHAADSMHSCVDACTQPTTGLKAQQLSSTAACASCTASQPGQQAPRLLAAAGLCTAVSSTRCRHSQGTYKHPLRMTSIPQLPPPPAQCHPCGRTAGRRARHLRQQRWPPPAPACPTCHTPSAAAQPSVRRPHPPPLRCVHKQPGAPPPTPAQGTPAAPPASQPP